MYRIHKKSALALSLSLLLLFPGTRKSPAQQSPHFQMMRDVFSGGASVPCVSTHFSLHDVAGQASPIGSSSSLHYDLLSGFLGMAGIKMAPSAILALPSAATGVSNSTVQIPIRVSTDSLISMAQFVVEYNSSILTFQSAELGHDLSPGSFNILFNASPGFPPSTPGCDRNVSVQVSSATASFSGNNREVVILTFFVGGSAGQTSPLAFDVASSHTYLTTSNFQDLHDGNLQFQNGSFTVSSGFTLSGKVLYYAGARAVPNVTVTLQHSSGGRMSAATNSQGDYLFTNLSPGNITLSPEKSGDVRNITGADALLVLRYLAFLASLTDDQQFAADVTGDGTVSGADALAILRYLAFFTTNIGATGTWAFQPSVIQTSLNGDLTDQNFTAYLLGEVTGDWQGSTSSPAGQQADGGPGLKKNAQKIPAAAALSMDSVRVFQQQSMEMPISIEQLEEPIHTLVLTVRYDASLFSFQSANLTPLSKNFLYAVNDQEEGRIHIAMASAEGVRQPGEILELRFDLRDGSTPPGISELEFASAYLNDHPVSRTQNGRFLFEKAISSLPEKFELAQNYPNPFNPSTVIRYALPGGEGEVLVDLYIFDVRGRRIRRLVHEKKAPGYYSVTWDGRDDDGKMAPAGVYLYTIRAGRYRASRKMALVR